jgi:hypothetical protein
MQPSRPTQIVKLSDDVKEVFESVGSKSIIRSETSLTVLKGGAAHSHGENNVSYVSAAANHGCVRPCRVTSGAILPNAQVKGKEASGEINYAAVHCTPTYAYAARPRSLFASSASAPWPASPNTTYVHPRSSCFDVL